MTTRIFPSATTSSSTAQRGIGIYLRKSSRIQGELSLPAQERLIRAVLEGARVGQPVYRVYRDVLSGRRADRADYQQMLADARAGRLTTVAFHKVNRFGRDAAEGLAAVNELRRLGISVLIADLPSLDIYKPEGMLIFTVLLGQGQYQVEDLGSEAIKGMQEMALAGGWPFTAPDGYRNCREYIDSHRRRCWVEVDRPRAAIIRLVYRWYRRGTVTLRDIAAALNDLHLKRTARGKPSCLTPRGKTWGVQQILQILSNPFYRGIVEVPAWEIRVRGVHPAIISPTVFDEVQAVLASHSAGPLKQHAYLLKGRLVMVHNGGSERLRCSTANQRNLRYYYRTLAGGRREHFNADGIDLAVLSAIRQRLVSLGPNPQAAIAQRMRRALAGAQMQARQSLRELRASRKRLLHLGTTGRFTDAEIAGEMLLLNGETAEAERELRRLDALTESQEQMIEEWQQIVTTLERWETISTEEQQALVAKLIERVEIDTTGAVTRIAWSVVWDQLLSDTVA
jgi:DNA invertase Pin-like site-specific DNA recombinase